MSYDARATSDRLFHSSSCSCSRCILVCNLILVIVGSIYTKKCARRQKEKCRSIEESTNVQRGNAANSHDNNNNSGAARMEQLNTIEPQKSPKSQLIVDQFFYCFCLSKNSSIITTDRLGSNSIEVIHGIR